MASRIAAVVVVLAVAAGAAVALTRNGSTASARAIPVLRGDFQTVRRPTSGTATVVDRGGRQQVILSKTFTTFEAAELLLLVTPSGSSHATKVADLKWASGSQRYDVPKGLEVAAGAKVSIWCDLCHATWGTARLRAVTA